MKFPDRLNWHNVVAARDRGDGTAVLLCHDPDDYQPWVTCRWSPLYPAEWFWGHYYADEERARRDFAER
jgi:hypothetical protein